MGQSMESKKASPNRLVGLVLYSDLLTIMGVSGVAVLFFSMSVRNFALITIVTFGLSLIAIFVILQPFEDQNSELR